MCFPRHGSHTWAGTTMQSIILYATILILLRLVQQFSRDTTASYLVFTIDK